MSGLLTALFQSTDAFCQPQRSLNSSSSSRSRPAIVCITGRIGTSKNLSTFKNALLCVRPMNFWPTRQTLIDSGMSSSLSVSYEARDECNGGSKGCNVLASHRARFAHRVHQRLNVNGLDEMIRKAGVLAALDVVTHAVTAERDALEMTVLRGVLHHLVAAAIGKAKVADQEIEGI